MVAKRSQENEIGASHALLHFTIEAEQEEDGRWIAEVLELPGVLTYGATRTAAIAQAQALALRVLAERLEYSDGNPST